MTERDGRLDWRDPNMPLYDSIAKRMVSPDWVQAHCARKFEPDGSVHPMKVSYWRNDPTYNMRIKTRRKAKSEAAR